MLDDRFATCLVAALLFAGCLPTPHDPPVDADEATATEAEPTVDASRPTTIGTVERLDDRLDALIAIDAAMEVVAEGFEWSEGPVWVPANDAGQGGFLLFSDVPKNTIYRYGADGHRVWLTPSGYTDETPRGGEPGSNGLTLDAEGQLVLCQHGDRRVARLDAPWDAPTPTFSTLADRHDGKRFHSPNDLVFDAAGRLYFTDPPYGLDGGPDGPGREMDFQGVYRRDPDGSVALLTDTLSRPNGIALSPDERTLYVANSDPEHAVWMAWDLSEDGAIENGRVFFDATAWVGDDRPGLPDGLRVDQGGHLFATGPGGVLIFSPAGEHLGTLRLPHPAANCAFGEDGSTLFITADFTLLRVPLLTRGLGFDAAD
ncbi:MAG: SMP-30/gluconolactonase/LRE family protein [Acidobacteriota bacterium]